MKKVKHIAALLIVIVLLLQFSVVFASATASCKVTVSKSTLSVGDTLTVTVKFTDSSSVMGAVDAKLTFNSDVLQFVSGSNSNLSSGDTVSIIAFGDGDDYSVQATVKFKCIAAGKSSLSVEGSVLELVSESVTSGISASKSVTVRGDDDLSTDATLKSIIGSYGTLSPAFSPSTTSYSVTVPNDVTTYSITAAPNHSGARTSISGSKNLKVGLNTRSITVTAEDGITTKVYTIKITREKGPLDNSGDTSSSEILPDETLTPSDGYNFKIGEVGYSIASEWMPETLLPAGFHATEYSFGEGYVAALRSSGGMLLLYAKNETDDGVFVIYNETSESFYRFKALEFEGESYVLTSRRRNFAVPYGFSPAEKEILGEMTEVWVNKDGNTLIFATSTVGNTGFYMWDSQTGRINEYVSENPPAQAKAVAQKGWLERYFDNSKALAVTVLAEAAVIVILLVTTVVFLCLYFKKRNQD